MGSKFKRRTPCDKFVIYQVINKINGKAYIGVTVNFKNRVSNHWYDARQGKQTVLCRAIRKYGKDSFVFVKIDSANTWNDACEKEKEYIKKFSTKVPRGMNMTDGGEGVFGLIQSEKAKRQLSEFFKGLFVGEDSGASKLTEKEVIGIRKEYKKGNISQSQLGEKYNVNRSTIKQIVSGETWSYLSENVLTHSVIREMSLKFRKEAIPIGEKHHFTKLTEQDVIEIRKEYKGKGVFLRHLSEKYGITVGSIQCIVSGKSWPHIQEGILTASDLKRKRSESQKGKPAWNKGKTGIYSEDTLEQMSISSKGTTAGENNGNTKLVSRDIIDIRDQYEKGNITYHRLAEEYDMHPDSISNIIRKETWAHI